MTKKYEFTGETSEWYYRILRQIRRLSDGKIGGWIEKKSNLSHEGDCWVDDNARVGDNALISGDALVYGNAQVYNNARVFDSTRIYDNAQVYNNAIVCGGARIGGKAWVSENAKISGSAHLYGGATIISQLHYQFNLDKITYYVMEGNFVSYSYDPGDKIGKLIGLWHNTVPGINLEKFLKEVL